VNGVKIEAKSRYVNMSRENGRYRYQVRFVLPTSPNTLCSCSVNRWQPMMKL